MHARKFHAEKRTPTDRYRDSKLATGTWLGIEAAEEIIAAALAAPVASASSNETLSQNPTTIA